VNSPELCRDLRGIAEIKKKHDGASNTRVVKSGPELRNTLRPVGWFVLPEGYR